MQTDGDLEYDAAMGTSFAPGVLIAMPQLDDPNFVRSVVLMVHHDDEGAMGLVINRQTDVLLSAFCAEHDLPFRGEEDLRLHFGGPCELQRGFLLHQDPETAASSLEVAPGIYLSTEVSSVRAVLERGRGPYRFLLGYAGWGAGQLEREMAQGAWLTAPARVERAFQKDAHSIWAHCLGDLGIDPATLMLSTERH